MPHPVDQPFPFPNGYETNLKKKLRAGSIKDYVAIFEKRKTERPGEKLAEADVQEIFRLAEDVGFRPEFSIERGIAAYAAWTRG